MGNGGAADSHCPGTGAQRPRTGRSHPGRRDSQRTGIAGPARREGMGDKGAGRGATCRQRDATARPYTYTYSRPFPLPLHHHRSVHRPQILPPKVETIPISMNALVQRFPDQPCVCVFHCTFLSIALSKKARNIPARCRSFASIPRGLDRPIAPGRVSISRPACLA